MSEMKEIKKIGVLSAGKIAGVLYLALGLLIGIPLACFALFFSSLFATSGFDSDTAGAFLVSGVGGVAVYGICLPIFYGVIGFIGGAIMALIYNIVAGFMGGIELELSDVAAKY